MIRFLRMGVVAVALATSGLLAIGCGGGHHDEVVVVPAQTGSVSFHWSVEGTFDPAACDANGAAEARIDIYDINGTPIVTQFADCRAFRDHVDLYAGRYSARVQMVDVARQPRSTSIAIEPFTIIEATDLAIDLDFPRNSFF